MSIQEYRYPSRVIAVHLLTLFYREGCHLCDKMLQDLYPYLERPDVSLQRVDIDEDDQWREKYNALVPVLHLNDEPLCKYHLDISRLDTALSA